MILRRLADAIRDQSWFTVALEIMIVVIGIFIGLQVDGWNEWRKERSAERDYLERLLVETRLNIKQVTKKSQSYFDRANSLQRIVTHLSEGSAEQITTDDLTRAFCYWYVPEGVRLQSSTYGNFCNSPGQSMPAPNRKIRNSARYRSILPGRFASSRCGSSTRPRNLSTRKPTTSLQRQAVMLTGRRWPPTRTCLHCWCS